MPIASLMILCRSRGDPAASVYRFAQWYFGGNDKYKPIALTGNEPLESVIAACDRSMRTYRDGMQVEMLALISSSLFGVV